MARRCELSGKGVLSGNNVSHAHNKTRRRFIPNLQKVSLISEILGRTISMRLSVSSVRSVEKAGGLDAYLVKADDKVLSAEVSRLKKRIKKLISIKTN